MQGENHFPSVSRSASHFGCPLLTILDAVATVGTTSSGAVDDLQEIGSVCTSYFNASIQSRY